jgi:glutamate N-acetyltransferase/amino-acid N-acetyltransferase
MNDLIQWIDGSITSPKGFLAAGVACGLKKNGGLDLAVILSESSAKACGVFTKNLVKGHSLQRTMRMIEKNTAKAVVINSGNANACLGEAGERDAEQMALELSGIIGCSSDEILTGSTGVIGQRLPMEKIHRGIYEAASQWDSSIESGHQAELAIMTTDLLAKEFALTFPIGDKKVVISGMAKGSGMIHPNMATMISILTTDCNIDTDLLQKALSGVTETTYNRVSVDGDTSVCDMVLILANGKAENTLIDSEDSYEYTIFYEALEAGCRKLSRLIAQDGEGATKLIEINLLHAATREDALKVLHAVAKSPLVKTAIFGEDANWGRILTAVGYSGAQLDPDRCNIFIGDLQVCANGTALLFDEVKAKSILAQKEIHITIDLRDGAVDDHIWTCDFSYDYVKINGSYRS